MKPVSQYIGFIRFVQELKKMAAFFYIQIHMCVVLQLSHVHFNKTELQ